MAKELNEDTSFKISIKTLAGIAALIFTLVGMTTQKDVEEIKVTLEKIEDKLYNR